MLSADSSQSRLVRLGGVFFSDTPELHSAFCPTFCPPTFPVLSVTLSDSNPPLSGKKRSNLSNVKNDARQKTMPATPSQEQGLCPPLGFQPPSLLKIAGRRPATFSRNAAEGPKVGV